jgi:hypothetical protein
LTYRGFLYKKVLTDPQEDIKISPDMNHPLNYIVSNYGVGIAVGIAGDPQEAEQDAVLAENIYGCNYSDHLFTRLIHMKSFEQFKKFLTLKEYFKVWDNHFAIERGEEEEYKRGNVMKFTREAIKNAREVINNQVSMENFMFGMSSRNAEYVLGRYQDEAGEE